MQKSSNLILGMLFALVILAYFITKILDIEGKTSAKQYREEYREQGRKQVRAEAVEAGVADYTEEGFVWRTNDIQRLEGELHNILIEALELKLNKRSGYAKEDSEEKGDSQEKSEEKFTGESQEESEEEGSGESQEEKRTSTQAEDGDGDGRASEGSQEEGTPSRSEEQDL